MIDCVGVAVRRIQDRAAVGTARGGYVKLPVERELEQMGKYFFPLQDAVVQR